MWQLCLNGAVVPECGSHAKLSLLAMAAAPKCGNHAMLSLLTTVFAATVGGEALLRCSWPSFPQDASDLGGRWANWSKS